MARAGGRRRRRLPERRARRPGGRPALARGSGQRPSPEEMRRRMAAMPPPAPSAMQMTFDEYATVDGVKLPKRISLSADGTPSRNGRSRRSR